MESVHQPQFAVVMLRLISSCLDRFSFSRNPLPLSHESRDEDWELLPTVILSNIFENLLGDKSELFDHEIVVCVHNIHLVSPAWRFALSEMMRGEDPWAWLHRRIYILEGNKSDFIKRGQAIDSFTMLDRTLEEFDFFGREASPKNVLYIKETMEKVIGALGDVVWLFTVDEDDDSIWCRCYSEAQYDETWDFLVEHVPKFGETFGKPPYNSFHEWGIQKLSRQKEGTHKLELLITFNGKLINWGSDWEETLAAQRNADLNDPQGTNMFHYENPALLMNGRMHSGRDIQDPTCQIIPVISMSAPREGMTSESRVGYSFLNISLRHADGKVSDIFIEGMFSGRGGFSSWGRQYA